MKEIKDDPEGKWKLRYICTYCGTPFETAKQAEQCWQSHSELTWEPVWGGIGSGSDMPIELIVKRHERGMITEIAVYKLESKKKVMFKEKKI